MQNKKSNKKIIIITIIVIAIIGTILFIKIRNSKKEENTKTTSIVKTNASTQTIQKTLTGSGEIVTSNTEKLSLDTAKYFNTMCVEKGDSVSAGDNILKYTNGTYLTAPYNCVINEVSVPSTGSICKSENYIEIQNTEKLNMTLSINESEIKSVKVGQEATIKVNAVDNKTYQAVITKIDSIGSYSTSGSTFTASLEFENDGDIKLGMSASCTIILEEAKDCIAVPIAAIQTSGDSKYVVVVKENEETENVTVETGISNDNYVQIISGLNGNEEIQMIQTTSSSKRSYSTSGNSERGSGMQGGPQGGMSGMQGGSMPSGRPGKN